MIPGGPLRRFGLALGLAVVASARPAVADQPGYTRTTYTYKRVADCDIKADVYRTAGNEVRPVVIWIHGGALIFGDRTTIRPDQLGRYLDAGFVVVSIDYRLAPETKLAAILEDVRDGYRWVRERGPGLFQIDPDRVALVGNSAGAYLALMVGQLVTPRPKAVASFYGYGEITRDWTTRPDPQYLGLAKVSKDEAARAVGSKVLSESPLFPRVQFYNYCRQTGRWAREVAGIDPTRQRVRAARFAPIQHVTKEFPPTILVHGDQDRDVPYEESVRFAAALKQHGVIHQSIRMRGYDHLFDVFPTGWTRQDAQPIGLQDPKVAAAYDQVIAFLHVHVNR
jgi:acetyl esterase/lipase